MNIIEKLFQEIKNLLHIHPSNITAVAAKHAEVVTLAADPGVPVNVGQAAVALADSAAAATPPEVSIPTVAAEPVQPPATTAV